MSHLESMMSFYRSELSDKIKKLSMPLDTTFGVDVFWYHVNSAAQDLGVFNCER